MKILAIDTATEACSAALSIDNEIIDRYKVAPRQHAELILPMVDELLAESGYKLTDLDTLAFGRGPGAFTGVRIATGVIQGLAFSAELPVVPISTLAAMAQGAISKSNKLISAIDARMSEIYWCYYESGDDNVVAMVGTEQITKPEDIELPETESWFGIGTGWQTYHETLTTQFSSKLIGYEGERYPNSRDIITLAIKDFNEGKAVSAEEALPIYLRNKVTR